jgi:hypothetical protein
MEVNSAIIGILFILFYAMGFLSGKFIAAAKISKMIRTTSKYFFSHRQTDF